MEQHGGDYAMVEHDDLVESECKLLCYKGLLVRFRDDDIELWRSSCFTSYLRVLFVTLIFCVYVRMCLYGLRIL